jgi:hypothetical protein
LVKIAHSAKSLTGELGHSRIQLRTLGVKYGQYRYPYFIQFFCREVFDVWIAKMQRGEVPSVPIQDITRKSDADFFHGRWAKATDRQRELLQVVSALPNADQEFTVQEVVAASQANFLRTPFTSSHISQMLSTLAEVGLVYKNRRGILWPSRCWDSLFNAKHQAI